MNTTSYYSKKFWCIPVMIMTGILFSCGNELDEIREVTVDDDTPQEQLDTVVSVLTDWGKVQMRLKSPQIDKEYGRSPTTHFPEGFYLEFYDSTQAVEATLKANRGVIYEKQNRMEAFGNVVFQNFPKDQTMYTEHLIWDQSRDDSSRIYTDKYVEVHQGKSRYWANKGLVATENFDWYKLRDFHAILVVEDSTANK